MTDSATEVLATVVSRGVVEIEAARRRLSGRSPMRRVIFMHLPKCGGTSVARFFYRHVGFPKSGCSVELADGLSEDDAPDLLARARAARFVTGHFGWDVLQRIRGRALVFTVLRDPLERLWAHFHYARSHPKAAHRPRVQRIRGMSFIAFCRCDDPEIREVSDNPMTRLLCRGHRFADTAGIPDRALVDGALANLATFDRVVPLHRLDAGLAEIADVAGLPRIGGAPRINRTARYLDGGRHRVYESGPSAAERAAAEPRIALDRAVYDATLQGAFEGRP